MGGKCEYLRFNTEDLDRMSQKIRSLCEELSSKNASLQEEMNVLRNDWDTPAGRSFFANIYTDWMRHIQNYITTMQVLQGMIDYAAAEYAELEEEELALRFHSCMGK